MTLESTIRGMQVITEASKYDLYHKDFSSAMQYAYKAAKKMYGITIDPDEIDSKVATGPKKPSEGKTNKYRLKGDKGSIQIQVYNKGGSKPFELNMYKEDIDLDEAIPKSEYYYVDPKGVVVAVGSKDAMRKMNMKQAKDGNKGGSFSQNSKKYKVGDKIKEEVEVDETVETNFDEIIEQIIAEEDELNEGKMKELHALITKGMSAEDIAKKMNLDVKTIKSLMSSKDYKEEEEGDDEEDDDKKAKKDNPKKTGKEKVEINPEMSESAASDAYKDIKKDKDLAKRKKDSADDSSNATDQDKSKLDSRNILMQLKKASDNPKHKVKFADGKSVAIKPGIVKAAMAVLSKLKSNDREKVQAQMQKSYKDMVKALQGLMKKAGYHENIEENSKMERMGISSSLVDAVNNVLMGKRPVEEKSGDAAAYKKFFDAALKKFKVGSPAELEGEQKKKFYDYIDKNWESDAEKAGKDEEVQNEEVDLDEGKMKDLLIKAEELMGPSKNRKEGIQMVAKGLKVSEKEATKLVDAVLKMNASTEY